jgi:aminomethyltransferase
VVDSGIIREGAEVVKADGSTVAGHVTSGTFSPALKQGVGFAYIPKQMKLGEALHFRQKGKGYAGKVAKAPFVAARQRKL